MRTTAVEVLHDDGRWYLAQFLGQHRDRATGEWRCGVRYTVGVGMQHQRVVWAYQCRRPPAEDEIRQCPQAQGGDQVAGDRHRGARQFGGRITSRAEPG